MPLPSVAGIDCTVLGGADAGAGVDMHVLSSCPAMRDTGVVTLFQINLKQKKNKTKYLYVYQIEESTRNSLVN